MRKQEGHLVSYQTAHNSFARAQYVEAIKVSLEFSMAYRSLKKTTSKKQTNLIVCSVGIAFSS